MLGTAVVDAVTGPEYNLLPVYAAGPALASARGPVRNVAVMGGLALALCLLFAWKGDRFGNLRMWVAVAAILYVTLASAYAARARRKVERRLIDVGDVARTLEDVLFTPVPPELGPVRLGTSYVSAGRATRIGGDLYDVEPWSGGVRLVVGDVQGKGLEAVRYASVVLTAFREAAPGAGQLAEVGRRIEAALERRTDGRRFVTGILAQLGADGGLLVYNHGHPPPLLLPREGEAVAVASDEPVPPFGLTALTGPADLRGSVARTTLRVGDRLFFYTDGLSEARDDEGRFYPVHERVTPLLATGEPEEALRRVRADVAAYSGGPPDDDSALLLLEFRGPPA
ncbi:serine/threonine-protein phosphatase [Streptomyces sp. 130]|uniref:PP2C family protein-serine/threonine phosphatase n=1 Tax=Streptomyces sp. 130 TaxID=2591006 RepID=UPI00117CD0DF|nr:PP2C family protein-serine/threonine phosphatase [Streptomyces sp. 130]TRV77237.1 serine/threonine-protein phosphatase [Streptomyces sp. 130]